MSKHSSETLKKALNLAAKGYNKKEVSQKLNVPYSTITSWWRKYDLKGFSNDPLYVARVRINHLLEKSRKTKHDYKEISFLNNLFIEWMKVRNPTLNSDKLLSRYGED